MHVRVAETNDQHRLLGNVPAGASPLAPPEGPVFALQHALASVLPWPSPSSSLKMALGWTLWLVASLLEAQLRAIVDRLTPEHPLLRWQPSAGSPTSKLLRTARAPMSETLPSRRGVSKHEQLFWGGARGPALMLFAMRLLMLISAISLGSLLMGVSAAPTAAERATLLLTLLPVLHVPARPCP